MSSTSTRPSSSRRRLFEELNLPTRKKTKSGYSTNAEVLESLLPLHPVISKILDYRTVAKLKSTYCDSLIDKVAADGRIHSSFNQTETRTGRISSTEPNLQNIPVRTERGKEFRRFFRAKDGCVLVDADYSQIELRVLAHMAGDQTMRKAFTDNIDIHTVTASEVFGVPIDQVTPLMRSRAKAVNFGIVYGIGAFSLSKDIGVTVREAQKYIDNYLARFSAIDSYMNTTIQQAKEDGYVQTSRADGVICPSLPLPTSTPAPSASASRVTRPSRAPPPISSRSRWSGSMNAQTRGTGSAAHSYRCTTS